VLCLPVQSAPNSNQYVQRGVVHVTFGRAEFYSRKNNKSGCSKSPNLVRNLKSIADAERLTIRHATAWGSQLLYTQRQAMLVRHACHKHHRKHMHDSPAAAAVGRDRSQVGSREEYMQGGHTGRALFSRRSNKEACNVKAQWHPVHRSTQGWCCRGCLVLHKCSSMLHDTALQAHCKIHLAEHCLVGTRSM
jgi:hypothetical protein